MKVRSDVRESINACREQGKWSSQLLCGSEREETNDVTYRDLFSTNQSKLAPVAPCPFRAGL